MSGRYTIAGAHNLDSDIDLGRCCCCQGTADVRNIGTLNRRAPLPGTGWGCAVCNMKADGAVVVLCDGCLRAGRRYKYIVHGVVRGRGRILAEGYPDEPFGHDLLVHVAHQAAQGPLDIN